MELPAAMISVRLLSHIAFSQSERSVFIYMRWLLSLVLMQRRRLILRPAHLQHQRLGRSGCEHTHTHIHTHTNTHTHAHTHTHTHTHTTHTPHTHTRTYTHTHTHTHTCLNNCARKFTQPLKYMHFNNNNKNLYYHEYFYIILNLI